MTQEKLGANVSTDDPSSCRPCRLDAVGAQAPVKIRAGWVSTPASLIPLLFLKPGVTGHNGKSYIFEPIYFSSSTLQITAISHGELDLAPSATPAFRSQ